MTKKKEKLKSSERDKTPDMEALRSVEQLVIACKEGRVAACNCVHKATKEDCLGILYLHGDDVCHPKGATLLALAVKESDMDEYDHYGDLFLPNVELIPIPTDNN